MDRRVEHEIEHGKKLAEGGAEKIWGWETAAGKLRARRRADLILAGGEAGENGSILEIGCGTGNFTEIFIGAGAHILAIDISPDLLKLAHARGLPAESVTFEQIRFEDIPITVQFDAVIGSSILHHLDLTEALPIIFRLLKPGKKMCFAEPNMLNPQILVQKNIPWIKKMMGDSPDETAFFRWRFKKQLETVGFTEVEITPFDWLHPATPNFATNFVQSMGTILEKIPLLQELAGSLLIKARRPK
jgi:SAM-dependent methyltransferase